MTSYKNPGQNLVKLISVLRFAVLAATALVIFDATADSDMAQRIKAQQAMADRHEFDLPRDAGRKPVAAFAFLGIEEGMTVLDVGAYAGYTTEMLSAAVGPSGTVYSHNSARVLERYADGYYKRTMEERLSGNRLPNVRVHVHDYLDLGLEEQIDVAFLGNLLHDFYHDDGEEKAVNFLRAIARTLKPNGVFGITDHVGVAGRDNAKLHRIQTSVVKSLLRQAGIEVIATSNLYANSADDHSLMVYNDAIYRQTDRFFFRVRKVQ
jgi:predicted methyltransferase